jgi:hypothetical protein
VVTVMARSKSDAHNSASECLSIAGPGPVTATKNPQVALYTITPPANAAVSIQFGTHTSYGLTTWTQTAPSGGGPVSTYVTGMRAVVHFTGSTVNDSDHTFTMGTLPAASLPALAASTTAGQTPQSGVELLDLLNSVQTGKISAVVTDLSANVLWGYDSGLGSTIVVNRIKLSRVRAGCFSELRSCFLSTGEV